MLIGTAGHIDHGKTSLVKALTGVDTDRLKEEKARGISIELGYAYQPLEGGGVLGFIDVPGHEKFIHHMLAGATGIDSGLLVVAADDGVMPQTREHLEILSILGVSMDTVALTKVDHAAPERVAQVEGALTGLVPGKPVFRVSAVTGEGIDALRVHLHGLAAAHPARTALGQFRLAVDRSFTLTGAGTVITGTVFAGMVRVGEELVVSPSGRKVRVRGLHAQNRPATEGRTGERCALNLAGVSKEEVRRGDWIVAGVLHAPCLRLDARLRVSASAPRGVHHWMPVHLHLGAADLSARVAVLEGGAIEPGGSACVQLVLESPHDACRGDVYVIRDQSAVHTLGGGIILEPDAPARRRRSPERLAVLDALESPEALARLLEISPQGVDLARFARGGNVPEAQLEIPGMRRVRASDADFGFAPGAWERLQEALLRDLAQYHGRHPDEQGPDAARARRMWLPRLAPPAFQAVLEDLTAARRLSRSGPWLHLPEHRVSFTEAEQRLAERLLPLVDEGGCDPLWVRDLARKIAVSEQLVRNVLVRLMRRGDVFQVVKDLFYSRRAIAELAALAAELERSEGEVRAAVFRDRTGLGRKRAIQVLEFFDRIGYTRRVREAHRLRADSLFMRKEFAPGGAAGLQTQ